MAVAFFRLLDLLSYAHFDILKLTQFSLDEIYLSRLLWKTENNWHFAVRYSTREAHFAHCTNELKLPIGATHTSRYMSVYFWSAVIEIFAMHWADKQIRMAQDCYTTKQLKSKNLPRLNTRGITNCQHFAPLNVCNLGYSAG